jgi:PEP-CTERM motif
MKTLQTLALGAFVAVGLTYNAKAGVITPLAGNPFTTADQNESSILAAANAAGVDDYPAAGDADLSVDVRLVMAGTTTNSFGTFTVTDTSTTGVETFSFSLNPGYVLAGLSLHDGSGNVVNFYSVNDETSGTNEGPVSTPSNGSGSPGALSNFDFLLETSPIPEPGTAVMLLLGCGLAGLVHRRFGRR